MDAGKDKEKEKEKGWDTVDQDLDDIFEAKQNFWKQMTGKYALTRRSLYTLLTVLCHNLPHRAESLYRHVAPVVLVCFGEKESANHLKMWHMISSFVAHFPLVFAEFPPKKYLFPNLFTFLSEGCSGSEGTSYPSLSSFVVTLHRHGAYTEDSQILQTLSKLWHGIDALRTRYSLIAHVCRFFLPFVL